MSASKFDIYVYIYIYNDICRTYRMLVDISLLESSFETCDHQRIINRRCEHFGGMPLKKTGLFIFFGTSKSFNPSSATKVLLVIFNTGIPVAQAANLKLHTSKCRSTVHAVLQCQLRFVSCSMSVGVRLT